MQVCNIALWSCVQWTTCTSYGTDPPRGPKKKGQGHLRGLLSSLSVADCGAPAELENGVVTFSTRNNLTTYKSEIRYSCQRPYYKMLHNTTGEPCILTQPTPSSYFELRVRLGANTASLLAIA